MKVASFEEREWIDPWNDRRPMTEEWVLVTVNESGHRYVTLGYYADGEWCWFDADMEVTAWMPLPEVYRRCDSTDAFGEEWMRQ